MRMLNPSLHFDPNPNTHSIMDSLFHKIGQPPYRFDQILPLLDEVSSLSSNAEKPSKQFHDTAFEIVESIEALAWLVESLLLEVFPQFEVMGYSDHVGPYTEERVPPKERDILNSLGPRTLHLKDWLFDVLQLPSTISPSGARTARLCQYCNWSFRRLARCSNESQCTSQLLSIISCGSRCLLAIDNLPTFHVLEERSQQGCEFCLLLRGHLLSLIERRPLRQVKKFDSELVHIWIEFCWDLYTRTLKCVKVSLWGRGQCYDPCLHFTTHTTHNNVADELHIFRPPAPTSLDPANLDFIKRQLAATEKDSTNRYLPKRLLDIGSGTQSGPKLVSGQQAGVDLDGFKYATLSYCWGSARETKKQLKLTRKTQRILYTSIPLSWMTPVLRDAITISQILGLRYLWVDSLCIQQDGDSTDWEEQSQEMSHIFGNSWLTICAPASNSCLENFIDHIDRHSCSIQIDYVPKEGGQAWGSFSLCPLTVDGNPGVKSGDWIVRMPSLMRDLECSKWNTRGWVFQERTLSPRLLYFGARMVHFQHGNHVTSEDGSSTDVDFFDPGSHPVRYCFSNLASQLEKIQNQGPFITDLWYRLIAVSSPSTFTDRRDAFPAIAGMARRVHEFSKHRYLAGLWEEDLCCGLLWNTQWSAFLQLRPQQSPTTLQQALQIIKNSARTIAPSWSWASRQSCLDFMITNQSSGTCRVRRHLRPDFNMLQSRAPVEGVNMYGRIGRASISLFGSTISLAPGALASPRCASYHLCKVFPGNAIAFVQTDWNPDRSHAASARLVKQQTPVQFELLLIASCCSDRSIRGDTRATHSAPHNELAESESESAHHPYADVWSSKNVTMEMTRKKFKEAMRPQYIKSFYEDSHPGFDAAVDCDLCSDHSLRRDIWGLLIYPTGSADTFYRVGTFFSRAEHGGSAMYEGTKPRRIELV